eukprot:gene6352-biopygen6925
MLLRCANNSFPHGFIDCTNPEAFAADLTVSRVNVLVDPRFNDTGYAECNICVNGTASGCGGCACSNDDYVCSCTGPLGTEILTFEKRLTPTRLPPIDRRLISPRRTYCGAKVGRSDVNGTGGE